MIQPQQLQLPATRDPIAVLALAALIGGALWLSAVAPVVPAVEAQIAFATPTIGIVPTEVPTSAPVAAQAAPTLPPPTIEPATQEPEIVYVEVTPIPTDAPEPAPTAPPVTALPAGSIVILPTATMSNQEFIASFGPTPDPAAKCAFVGCLRGKP